GYKLEPGDVVSYYARASDNNTVTGPGTAATDIYFLQVRPYENDYRQQQGGGGGGGGGQQNDAGQLSQQERDIIATTFKTARDSTITDKKAFDENLATIRLSQQRLREQSDELANRLVERGIAASDSGWKKIAEILPKASAEMDTAEKQLTAGSPTAARRPCSATSKSRWAHRAAVAAAAIAPTPRISPTSSSCRKTACAISTRPCNAVSRISSSSKRTIRSTRRRKSCASSPSGSNSRTIARAPRRTASGAWARRARRADRASATWRSRRKSRRASSSVSRASSRIKRWPTLRAGSKTRRTRCAKRPRTAPSRPTPVARWRT